MSEFKYSLHCGGNTVEELVANLKLALESVESETYTAQSCLYQNQYRREFNVICLHNDKTKVGVLEHWNSRDGRHSEPRFKWYMIESMTEIS